MFFVFGEVFFVIKNDFFTTIKNTFAFYIFWGIFCFAVFFPFFTEINPYGFWYSTFIKAMKIWAIVCIVISTLIKYRQLLKSIDINKINLNSILEKRKNPGIKEYLKNYIFEHSGLFVILLYAIYSLCISFNVYEYMFRASLFSSLGISSKAVSVPIFVAFIVISFLAILFFPYMINHKNDVLKGIFIAVLFFAGGVFIIGIHELGAQIIALYLIAFADYYEVYDFAVTVATPYNIAVIYLLPCIYMFLSYYRDLKFFSKLKEGDKDA